MSIKLDLSADEFADLLENRIRRVVHEELEQLLTKRPDIFCLTPESPLYEDMEEIHQRQVQGKLKLYPHAEVWGVGNPFPKDGSRDRG